MRINVHDYSGHPFQVQLSRELARRGHEVTHQYASQYVTGHGRLAVTPDDPATLAIEALTADVPLQKYDPIARTRFEVSYARAWQQHLRQRPYDVVVACNVPLFALARMRTYFARVRQPWVLWHQDVYSLGVAAEVYRRLPATVSRPLDRRLQQMEARQVGSADAVVAIGAGFVDQYRRWGVDVSRVQVLPNWAPLDEIVPGPRDNAWAREQHLPTAPLRLLYAGTLGRKHNPMLLLAVLDELRARGVDAVLTVVSEGVGADDIKAAAGGRSDVRVLPYQPVERLPEVLASADAVLALLEPDAARFSVPSKILSYLAAGRTTVALVPEMNPCAADVRDAGGCVSPPTVEGAARAATWLAAHREPGELRRRGRQARALAEQRFDIATIGNRFEDLLADVAVPAVPPVRQLRPASLLVARRRNEPVAQARPA